MSMDGVRQDFVVEQAPSNPAAGELMVTLAVTGARVEPAAYGARLQLRESGREIAYSRLRAMDARGTELPARLEVCPGAEANLAVSGNTLYAGGSFTTAGTNVSVAIAEAMLGAAPVSVAIIITNAAFGLTNGSFGFDLSGPSGSNVVIEAGTDLRTWIPLQTNLLVSGLLYFSDSQSPTNRQRFYRALTPP